MNTASVSQGSLGLSKSEQMDKLNRLSDKEQLAEVSRQFESVFLRQYLQDALKPMFKGALSGEMAGQDIYRQFMVDALADKMSEASAFGFSSSIQAQIASAHSVSEEAEND